MINDNKLNENLSKVNHLADMLEMLETHKLDALVFNLERTSCTITYNEFAFEIEFEDSDYPTPETMIFYNTTRIEFYNLMYFITDNIRVTSNIYKEV
ncbi:MAG: hypothetical protein KH152_08750 [Finegoldia magna]|nr:hypothetical protein [Finegoldia magna]